MDVGADELEKVGVAELEVGCDEDAELENEAEDEAELEDEGPEDDCVDEPAPNGVDEPELLWLLTIAQSQSVDGPARSTVSRCLTR